MSAFTFTPTGDRATGGIVSGAASQHAALASTSTTSYVRLSQYIEADVTKLTLPDTAVTLSIEVRVDAEALTAADIDVTVLDGNTIIQRWTITADGTFATYTTDAVPVTLTPAAVRNLRVGLGMPDSSAIIDVAYVHIQLLYVTQPGGTMVDPDPDPWTASSLPFAGITHSVDTTGGYPTHFQMRTFDADRYGAFGSLDPATDDPFHDTGVLLAPISGVNHNTNYADIGPLPNDDYRVTARVAQTVNGVLHWSDWENSSLGNFEVNVSSVAVVSSVTVSAQSATGHIDVTVNRDGTSSAWELVEVERSIDAGTTWSPVRGATLVAPSGANSHTVADYEVGNGVDVEYRARAFRFASGLPIVGLWVSSSSTSWSSATACHLKDPTTPANNTTFTPFGRDDVVRSRVTGVFNVAGKANPVTVSDPRSGRTGQFRVQTADAAEAAAIDTLLTGGATVLVQYPATYDIDDMYATVLADTESFLVEVESVLYRTWIVEYVEVDEPTDASAGRI